jgi:hypothetical protein
LYQTGRALVNGQSASQRDVGNSLHLARSAEPETLENTKCLERAMQQIHFDPLASGLQRFNDTPAGTSAGAGRAVREASRAPQKRVTESARFHSPSRHEPTQIGE